MQERGVVVGFVVVVFWEESIILGKSQIKMKPWA